MAGFAPASDTLDDTSTEESISPDTGWNTLLFNDPVNLMGYVTAALISVLQVTPEQAHELMVQAHDQGRALVFHGTREEAEDKVAALHAFTLNAAAERAA